MMGQAAAEDQQQLLLHAVQRAWPGSDAVSQFKRAAASVLLSQPQQTARTHVIANELHDRGLSKNQLGIEAETNLIFEADRLFRRGSKGRGWQLDIAALRHVFEKGANQQQQQQQQQQKQQQQYGPPVPSAAGAAADANGFQRQRPHERDWHQQQQQQQQQQRWPEQERHRSYHDWQQQSRHDERQQQRSSYLSTAANGDPSSIAGPWQPQLRLPAWMQPAPIMPPYHQQQQQQQWQQQQYRQQPQLRLGCPFAAAKPWLTALSRLMQRELLPTWQEEDRQYAAQQQQGLGRPGSAAAVKSSKRRKKRRHEEVPRGAIAWVPGGVVGGDDEEEPSMLSGSAAAAGRPSAQDAAAAAREAAAAAAAQAAAAGRWGAAHSLMEKMGYRPGQGLGREGQGIKQPLQTLHNKRKRGLGFSAGQENDEQQEEDVQQQQQQEWQRLVRQQEPQRDWHDWQERMGQRV
uniref:G-patch domain-containing protein n=1 Tax=Tetradesmus obliquus TaxID=3088 RepID=A0A383WHN7_TETOB